MLLHLFKDSQIEMKKRQWGQYRCFEICNLKMECFGHMEHQATTGKNTHNEQ
jgi:hypothetical protein